MLTSNQVVPSAKAREGAWSKENKFSVWIKGEFFSSLSCLGGTLTIFFIFAGKCEPAQWVPMNYCFQNFWNMCVNMNKKDMGRANYGNGGCQTWHIKQF
jgi:hypothetical protein